MHMNTSATEQFLESYSKIDSGIWLPKSGDNSIPYSDGSNTEIALEEILSSVSDLSDGSAELNKHICDWVTFYHLSSYRSNLLKPLKNYLKGSILEIGAGCGALSRYLAENAQELIALEGSSKRASLCAKRCRNLNNISIICDRFEDLPKGRKFDAVTLIGVLEYSRIYGDTDNPPRAMLEHARSFLKDDGALVLAIENQLGLKYFAGANEDHLGQPWIGVADLYEPEGVVTFGKLELTELLNKSGFKSVEFYIPIPNYKNPVSVISAHELSNARKNNIDIASFFAQSGSAEHSSPSIGCFPLETAWMPIERNELLLDLANSFLVVAKPNKTSEETNAQKPIVYHYGGNRKRIYAKETTVSLNNNKVKIQRNAHLTPKENNTAGRYIAIWENEEACPGDLYINELFYKLNKTNWTLDSIANYFKSWIEVLKNSILSEDRNNESIPLLQKRLPNNYLDAIPFNLILTTSGDKQFFDLEWVDTQNETKLRHVLVRGIFYSLGRSVSVASPHSENIFPLDYYSLIIQIITRAGINISSSDIEEALSLENIFIEQITGNNPNLNIEDLQNRTLTVRPRLSSEQIVAKMDELRLTYETTLERERSEFTEARQIYETQYKHVLSEYNKMSERFETQKQDLNRKAVQIVLKIANSRFFQSALIKRIKSKLMPT
jgi:SAM-dependent methyltransferase